MCKDNQYDSLSLTLGVSSSDALREAKLGLLTKLGLVGVTHYNLYADSNPISAELLAFIRIFNMNQGKLMDDDNLFIYSIKNKNFFRLYFKIFF